MKKPNKRYKDHDICSMMGTKTMISYLESYINESLTHLKTIQEECNKPDFNPENLYIPVIMICDASSDIVQHKLNLLKSSLDRYLCADEDFKSGSIKHAKLTKIKRIHPNFKFRKYDLKSENFPQKIDMQSQMKTEVDDYGDICY